jgi:hypothetical protein
MSDNSCLDKLADLIVKSNEMKVLFAVSQKIIESTPDDNTSRLYFSKVIENIQTSINKLIEKSDADFIATFDKFDKINKTSIQFGDLKTNNSNVKNNLKKIILLLLAHNNFTKGLKNMSLQNPLPENYNIKRASYEDVLKLINAEIRNYGRIKKASTMNDRLDKGNDLLDRYIKTGSIIGIGKNSGVTPTPVVKVINKPAVPPPSPSPVVKVINKPEVPSPLPSSPEKVVNVNALRSQLAQEYTIARTSGNRNKMREIKGKLEKLQ